VSGSRHFGKKLVKIVGFRNKSEGDFAFDYGFHLEKMSEEQNTADQNDTFT
jgi:hypothetical protein